MSLAGWIGGAGGRLGRIIAQRPCQRARAERRRSDRGKGKEEGIRDGAKTRPSSAAPDPCGQPAVPNLARRKRRDFAARGGRDRGTVSQPARNAPASLPGFFSSQRLMRLASPMRVSRPHESRSTITIGGVGDHRLHDEALARLADVAGLRQADVPVPSRAPARWCSRRTPCAPNWAASRRARGWSSTRG